MYELVDSELDMVAGGHPLLFQGGLVNANVEVTDVLSHNQVTLTDISILNGNQVQVAAGIAVAVLSGATGVGVLNKMP